MKISLTESQKEVSKNTRCAKFVIMLFVANLIALSTVFAQEKEEKDSDSPLPVVSTAQREPAVTLGEIASLQSKVLNKTVPLSIHLPENYDSSNKTYPVLYMLDADYRSRFAMLASTWARTDKFLR